MPENMDGAVYNPLPANKINYVYRVFLLLILLGLVSEASVVGAIQPTNLKYFKLVQTPGFQGNQIFFIKLDREIYKYSEPGFSDVRLFDSREKDIDRIFTRKDDIGDCVPVPEYETSVDMENKVTIILIHTDNEPVTKFCLDIDPQAFAKKATVQKVIDKENVDIIELDIQGAVEDDAQVDQVTLSFDETRNVKYRIVIDDGDSEPLNVVGVAFAGPEYRIVFQGKENESYQLFWGEPDIEPPIQNASFLQRALSADEPIKQARVGRGFTNPRYGEPSGIRGQNNKGNSWVLFPIIAVILALLALVFAKFGKRKE